MRWAASRLFRLEDIQYVEHGHVTFASDNLGPNDNRICRQGGAALPSSVPKPLVDQPPDRFGAGGLRIRLPLDPGGDPRGQVGGDADAGQRGYARRRAAAPSFLIISY